MTTARTLHVRCATWDQVDLLLSRKLRKGRLLSLKVPFAGEVGSPVTLGLELPNQLVIAIDGTVQRSSPVEGDAAGNRTWIEIELLGLTAELLARIRAMREGRGDLEVPARPAAPPRASGLPPEDELPADERELFRHLSGELRRLRQAAVHDVLGVAPDAGPEAIRAAWKHHVRRHHPDLVARRSAPAISHLAEELTILTNRAYDRLRASLAAEGQAVLAGPSLAPSPGWLVGFEDLVSGDATPAPKPPPRRFDRAASPVPVAPPPAAPPRAATSSTAQGAEAFEQRARAMLAQGEAASAREVLAAALVIYPRSKPLRSLYYVATALAALLDGEVVRATAQLETALAHHEQCREAALMLEHVRRHGASNTDAMRRLFT